MPDPVRVRMWRLCGIIRQGERLFNHKLYRWLVLWNSKPYFIYFIISIQLMHSLLFFFVFVLLFSTFFQSLYSLMFFANFKWISYQIIMIIIITNNLLSIQLINGVKMIFLKQAQKDDIVKKLDFLFLLKLGWKWYLKNFKIITFLLNRLILKSKAFRFIYTPKLG